MARSVRSGCKQHWEADWKPSLPEAAFERVKKKCDAREFQIYDLAVVKGWSRAKIAKQSRLGRISVWLATNSIRRKVKAEPKRLRAIG